MKTYLVKILAISLLLVPFYSLAEDVDLFVGTPPAATDIPNVLIVLDNTANWNTAFTNEMSALVSVVNSLPENRFKLGLMMFTESGGGNSGKDGGYVRAAVRPLTAANKLHYQGLVNSLDKLGDKSNGGKAAQAMREAYLYFSGGAPYAGNQKLKTDYSNNNSGTAASKAIYALAGNALDSISGITYLSPVTSGCAKNFIIYISNGAAQDNTSDNNSAKAALAALAAGSTATIALSPSGSQDSVVDEWARFMKSSSYGIVTYAIDVNKVTTGQGPGWTALLKSASAGVGGGKYFDVVSSGTQIADALNLIFTEIQSVNSVFASVSLPVSVNTQGTYLNQVYVGMFRPDENSLPRWAGNLKQYKLGFVGTDLNLLDADNAGAINGQTGFIAECARSFWTPTSLDNYWAYKPQGDCLAQPNSAHSNYPDGNIVEKGAQAYKLRSSTRAMYTCAPTIAGCNALTSFSAANTAITAGLLGVATAPEREATINWALGLDVDDEHSGDGVTPSATSSTVMRPSAHGDVVHSQPVAVNYGSDAVPQVVLFYGGNDGILRAINGNRSANIGTTTAGSELWSFMAPEFYPSIKRSRSNSPAISYPGSSTPGALAKSYGFDGSISTYISGNVKWLYASMRRGGRAIYGFDISAIGSPTQMWKRGCDSSGCSAGFSDIGQTWATPKVFKSAGYGAGAAPMLVMGGGYDSCEDADPNTCTATSKGRKIYIMDGVSGTLLNSFTTERGVVADVTIVNSNGLANYLYAADLGGNIYRISGAANLPIGAVAPSSWVMTKIAALGCSNTGSCAANRKFMFAPDVVVDSGTHMLLIGSGDREKPLTSYTGAAGVANYFFMLKDQPANANWLTTEQANCGSAIICLNSLVSIAAGAASPTQAAVDLKKGWYLQLAATEQVVTSAITVFGVVTFSTHTPAVPTAGACSNLGTAKVYNLGYGTASNPDGREKKVLGGGLPPSPVAGMITLDDGSRVPFIIGATSVSALESSLPNSPAMNSQPKVWIFRNGAR